MQDDGAAGTHVSLRINKIAKDVLGVVHAVDEGEVDFASQYGARVLHSEKRIALALKQMKGCLLGPDRLVNSKLGINAQGNASGKRKGMAPVNAYFEVAAATRGAVQRRERLQVRKAAERLRDARPGAGWRQYERLSI